MSNMKYLKTQLETKLYNLYNGVYPIKWVGLDFDSSTVNTYLAPSIIPISTNREVMSNTQGITDKIFFQVNALVRRGVGSGVLIDLVDDLKSNFSETTINNIIVEVPDTLNIAENGEFLESGIRVVCYIRGAIN